MMSKNSNKIQLLEKISKLISLGENRKELELYYDFFDIMDTKSKKELLQNLTNEIKKLEALKAS